MSVEICATNLDINDELVNGTDGIFKEFDKKQDIDIVWIEFTKISIGKQTRYKNKKHQYT